jgi:sec-independent protein translocase protein TatA
MGEMGKGITAFKRGVKEGADENETAAEEPRNLPGETARDVTPHTTPAAGSKTNDRS